SHLNHINQTLIVTFLQTVHCQGVTQHPEIRWEYVSKSTEMNCSHNKDAGHNQMYWYRQRPGETMKLIVYTLFGGQPDYGKAPENKYAAVKESIESGTLTAGKRVQLVAFLVVGIATYEEGFKSGFVVNVFNEKRWSLKISSTEKKDDAVYLCAARLHTYLGEGTRFTVLDEENIKLFAPSSKQCKNRVGQKTKTLVCLATHFYPDHVNVTWEVNGEQNKPNIIESTDAAAAKRNGDRYYSITSRLTVPSEVWTNPENNFTCIVDFFDGTKNIQTRKSISGVKGMLMWDSESEKYLKITHNAKLAYTVFIVKSSIYGAFVVFLLWKWQVCKI
uniref:Ig-like domain-containing protein n=1 Tax=Echeneis naucrates TaxID=173247 RepID=A0A665W4Q5_ECHNA